MPACEAEVAGAVEALEALLDGADGEVAAVLVEPIVQGAGGMRIHPASYLRGVRAVTRSRGLPLIADEIFTGFGRTGSMFACEHAGVAPGPSVPLEGADRRLPAAGGHPRERGDLCRVSLGAIDRGRAFFHGHSYTGNALACAVARESLALFTATDCLARVAGLQRIFARRLEVISALPGVARVRGVGALAVVELEPVAAGAGGAGQREAGYLDARGPRLAQEFLDRGVLLRPLGNVIYFLPPYVISDEECQRVFDVIEETILGSRRMAAR